MENKNQKSIDALNGLIEINNDRVDGYEKAAVTENQNYQELFRHFANQSRMNLPLLKQEVVQLGGEPATGNTTKGKFYHAWMEIKTAIMGKADNQAIINLCEFGEDAAVEAYDEALNTEGILPSTRALITEQAKDIKAAHDQVKALKEVEASK
jgi:uncharacterized protein (TIGR02284 family)